MNNKTAVNELIILLNKAIEIAKDNIENAHNFDLEDFSSVLENYVDELEDIEEFETFED